MYRDWAYWEVRILWIGRRRWWGWLEEDYGFVWADQAEFVVDLRDGAFRIAEAVKFAQLETLMGLESRDVALDAGEFVSGDKIVVDDMQKLNADQHGDDGHQAGHTKTTGEAQNPTDRGILPLYVVDVLHVGAFTRFSRSFCQAPMRRYF